MNFNQPVTLLAMLYFLGNLYACSSEPTTQEECIDKYMSGLKNDKAAKAIERACNEIFDANEIDDEYYKCLLEEMPTAKTDKDVNIILRRCRMKEYKE